MSKKVCKKCLIFVHGSECPICKGSSFSTNWQGRVAVMDVQKSTIAKSIGIEVKGEYSIKAR
jgi:RNA polymerase subunit RPABC4/transcription elongation factor Spt4